MIMSNVIKIRLGEPVFLPWLAKEAFKELLRTFPYEVQYVKGRGFIFQDIQPIDWLRERGLFIEVEGPLSSHDIDPAQEFINTPFACPRCGYINRHYDLWFLGGRCRKCKRKTFQRIKNSEGAWRPLKEGET